jgi:monomeric isocitrate dehydrogenase
LFITDEAPYCTYSFLPIVQAFTATAGEMETKDISLAAKFYQFPEVLNEDQKWKMLYLNLEI